MLLLLFAGAKAGAAPTPPSPLGAANVFCAYGTEDLSFAYATEDGSAVYAPAECFLHPQGIGWPDTLRRRAPREAVERLLQLQRDKSFGPRWFAEFEAAQRDFARKDVRAALAIGAKQAREVAEEIEQQDTADFHQPQLGEIAAALEAAATVLKSHKDALEAVRFAEIRTRALKDWLDELDDEEVLCLLI